MSTALVLLHNFVITLINSKLQINVAHLVGLAYQIFYVILDPLDGLLYSPVLYLFSYILPSKLFTIFSRSLVNRSAAVVHVICWILQFIGHGVFEKRKPALLDNLVQSLFIAPLFAFLETGPFVGYYPSVVSKIRANIKLKDVGENHPNLSEFLFPPSMVEDAVSGVVEDASQLSYCIRPLRLSDIDDEYLDLLDTLAAASSRPLLGAYQNLFMEMKKDYHSTYYIIVVEDLESHHVIGTATLFLERKFLRGKGICGHIEEVIVHPDHQRKAIGKLMVLTLIKLAFSLNSYKVILDCSDSNVGFYEKCGLSRAGIEMKKYASHSII